MFEPAIPPGPLGSSAPTATGLLSERVAGQILESILRRPLLPGYRLPSEREIGEVYGVSRTVVREAIRMLAAKGVIEARGGSGSRVVAVGPGVVSESFALYIQGQGLGYGKVHEIREVLEVEMAGSAAISATEADLFRAAEAHVAMEVALGDVELAARHDVEFHQRVAAATHNELYGVLLDAISPLLLDVRLRTLSRGSGPAAVEGHRQILAALTDRDPGRARQAMRSHLQFIGGALEGRSTPRPA